MSAIVTNEETKITSLESHTTIPFKTDKDTIFNMKSSVIINPIESTRISKIFSNNLTKGSILKAGLVFFGTIVSYYFVKNARIFSYFGLKRKNSKNIDNQKIMEVENRKNVLSVRTNIKTENQANDPSINQIQQTYKNEDKTVKFEEIKVEKFEGSSKVKKENVIKRRSFDQKSINVKNPIPNQSVIVEKLFNLTIDGTHVFNSTTSLFLDTLDIPHWLTSHYNPTLKGSYHMNDTEATAVFDNYAYVGGKNAGLQIIDISDPSNPTFKGSYNMPSHAEGIVLSGNYAHIADSDSGLQIIDVSDPSNPTFKGSYDTPGWAYGVSILGNYACVADGGNKYISGLQIIDVTDPANPTFKGSYDTPDDAFGVALSGNYAYLANGFSGLQIIDISDPSNPTFKGSYHASGYFQGITLSGNYAYMANEYLIQIIDVTNLTNPIFKSSYDMNGNVWGVVISGNYAYVAVDYRGYGSLEIIDISNSSNPTFKASYKTSASTYDVAFSDNYVYVADHAGLQIISPNLDKLTLLGTPTSVETYNVTIKACNEAKECITDSFCIIVKDFPPPPPPPNPNIYVTYIIIGSIIAICSVSFCCLSIIGGCGIIIFRRYRNRNKILRSAMLINDSQVVENNYFTMSDKKKESKFFTLT